MPFFIFLIIINLKKNMGNLETAERCFMCLDRKQDEFGGFEMGGEGWRGGQDGDGHQSNPPRHQTKPLLRVSRCSEHIHDK